jgi:uncharacterized protein
MVDYSFHEGQFKLRVQIVPRASRSEVVGEYNGALRIRVAAPPVDGAANEELIRVLAKSFKVSRSAVTIVSGHSGRIKQVLIGGARPDALESIVDLHVRGAQNKKLRPNG